MFKLNNLFIILCASLYLLYDRNYVDAKVRLSSRPSGGRSSFGSSNKHSPSISTSFSSSKPSSSFSTSSFNKPKSIDFDFGYRPRPYPSLGTNRYTPSIPHVPIVNDNFNDYYTTAAINRAMESNIFPPSYGNTWRPTTTTERPWSSLDNISVNQTVIKRVRQIVKQKRGKFIVMNGLTKGAYKTANRKILKLIDYDGKRKSYVVHHPLQRGELRFHAM